MNSQSYQSRKVFEEFSPATLVEWRVKIPVAASAAVSSICVVGSALQNHFSLSLSTPTFDHWRGLPPSRLGAQRQPVESARARAAIPHSAQSYRLSYTARCAQFRHA